MCSVTGLVIEPQNVAVVQAGVDSSGNAVVAFYVQIDETSFLSVQSLNSCVEVRYESKKFLSLNSVQLV